MRYCRDRPRADSIEDDGLLAAGHEIAKAQFILAADEEAAPAHNEAAVLPALEMTQDENSVYLTSDVAHVTFSKADGSITAYAAPDATGVWRDLIVPGMGPTLNIHRTATDNDRAGFFVFTMQWKETGAPQIERMETVRLSESAARVAVEAVYPKLNSLRLSLCYTVYGNGTICIQASIVPQYDKNFVYLPVFGLEMRLPAGFEQVTYFGKGPEENYIDRSNPSASKRANEPTINRACRQTGMSRL